MLTAPQAVVKKTSAASKKEKAADAAPKGAIKGAAKTAFSPTAKAAKVGKAAKPPKA